MYRSRGTVRIETIPTTLLYLNNEILMRISGADDRTLRKYLNEYIEVLEDACTSLQLYFSKSSNFG